MDFCWCTISVGDMDASLRFYEEIAGLPLISRHPAGPGTEIAFLGGGETKIELICREGQAGAPQPEGISIGFTVPSVDKMMALAEEKGIAVDGAPVQPNPHVRFFFVRDPDGVQVQFVENL